MIYVNIAMHGLKAKIGFAVFTGISRVVGQVELSGRGKNALENYNPSCKTCNCLKDSGSVEGLRRKLTAKLSGDPLVEALAQYQLIERIPKRSVVFYFEIHAPRVKEECGNGTEAVPGGSHRGGEPHMVGGKRRALLVLPTGTGKTYVFGQITKLRAWPW